MAPIKRPRVTPLGESTKYDDGTAPSVALNNSGVVVEVHEAASSLWCLVGMLSQHSNSVNWGVRHRYDSGTNPCVAINNHGYVVEVHESQPQDSIGPTLSYRIGAVNTEKMRVEWCSRHYYADGITPAVAMSDCGKVVTVYEADHNLEYRVGNIDECSKEIHFHTQGKYCEGGRFPSVAMNEHLEVIVVHSTQDNKLWHVVGNIDREDFLSFGKSIQYGKGHHPSVSLTDKRQVITTCASEKLKTVVFQEGTLRGKSLLLAQRSISFGDDIDSSVAIVSNGSARFVEVRMQSAALWCQVFSLGSLGDSHGDSELPMSTTPNDKPAQPIPAGKIAGMTLSTEQINNLIAKNGVISAMKDRRYEYEQYQECSPLMVASLRGQYDLAKLIINELRSYIESGGNEVSVYHDVLNLQDGNRQSALMFASLKAHLRVADLLLRRGAWVDQQDKDGQSALMLASSNGNTEVAEVLLNRGADKDLQDKKGLSALMHAIKNTQYDTAKLLLDRGADIDQQSLEWESAMSLALLRRHSDSLLTRRQSELIGLMEKKIQELSRCESGMVKDHQGVTSPGEDEPPEDGYDSDTSVWDQVTVPLTAKTLTLFKYRDQGVPLQNFRLVSMVSAKWKEFGRLLDFHENELEEFNLDFCGKGKTARCWCGVMEKWMERVKASWEKLYCLLKDAKCVRMAKDMKRALLLAVNIKPRPPLPAVQPPAGPIDGSSLEDSDDEESTVEEKHACEDKNDLESEDEDKENAVKKRKEESACPSPSPEVPATADHSSTYFSEYGVLFLVLLAGIGGITGILLVRSRFFSSK